MEHKRSIFFFFCLLSSSLLFTEIKVGAEGEDGKVKVVFAFGDSYADTGNSPISLSRSWKTPYGITFPGKPSGRFSDGRVFTDYIASFLGISSPVPFQLMNNIDTKTTRNGINFAHGGTGVFTTLVDQPNMTTQIDLFQQVIQKNVFTTLDLSSSVALVSLAGNDYAAYLAKNGTFQGLPNFTRSVIHQLIINVRRIHEIGIKKIGITGIGPLGCLPQNIASISYKNCDAALNNFSDSHNQMLKGQIWNLNSEAGAPIFIFLDLYTAFTSALQLGQIPSGDLSNKLKPCCYGDCGSVEKNEEKKYGVCENPNQSFFWDSIHPSNCGWGIVYSALNTSLHSLLM
ncbi:hypothetical protein ACS0TY_000725 [Phlomoides rotata]